MELIGEAIAALAQLFGIDLKPVDFGVSSGASAAGDMADNLGDAAGAAKKLKQYTAGFDELNVFDPNQGAGELVPVFPVEATRVSLILINCGTRAFLRTSIPRLTSLKKT